MTRIVLRRLLLSVFTLWMIITIVFVVVNVLPDDIGRRLSGPFAPQDQVDAINERLGTNDPVRTQYRRFIGQVLTLDFGTSFARNRPVTEIIGEAFLRSLRLAAYALALTLPLSIYCGILAARRKDTAIDRGIVTLGLASSSIPEFVSGVLLQSLVALGLGWFKVLGNPPKGAGILEQLEYMTLPALALVIVYFGYIARMTRAGVAAALQADFTRTATLKGLTRGRVMRRHVLRNGLQPTVSLIGVQVGYLLGSLVAVERVFNYPGLGLTIVNAATKKDLPVLRGGVLLVGVVYMLSTLIADLVLAWMNPRARATVMQ